MEEEAEEEIEIVFLPSSLICCNYHEHDTEAQPPALLLPLHFLHFFFLKKAFLYIQNLLEYIWKILARSQRNWPSDIELTKLH